MTPERLRQIEELYHAARERGPEEREVLLAQAAPELRREVESLLAQDASGDKVLDRPTAELLEESTVTQLGAGTRLGPYQIEVLIGAGGMGSVYRAVDTRLGRKVAIKIAAKHFTERFEREARAISALNHPHICTLYDVGPNYLVMELVEGETLATRLRKGELSLDRALEYGSQIADALAAAHTKGIIHRDLKPVNIMVTKQGVKVLDFGLARAEGDETLTVSRAIMGTPAYMAPEQLQGNECDARTDIYALGLVLREMTTGSRDGTLAGLPAQLAHVIERCLAKEPESRWHSAADLKFELEWSGKNQAAAALILSKTPARTRLGWVVGTLGVALIVLGALLWRGTRPVDRPLMAGRSDG